MNIYIPTMGRIETQRTWDRIPDSLRKQTFLVCPANEVKEHESRGRNTCICPLKGIAATRQFLVDMKHDKKLIMSDDDHYFFKRSDPTKPALVKQTPEDMKKMFKLIETLLDKYPLVGIAARQGSDAFLGLRKGTSGMYEIEPGLTLNKRTCNMYGVRTDILQKENIRFDEVSLMEDMHVSLSLIAKGYDVALITKYCWNQAHSGEKGGCSSYRNAELQKQAAIKLAELHRPFVSVIKKRSKDKNQANWKDVGFERYDVRVDWTGAAEAGRAARNGSLF